MSDELKNLDLSSMSFDQFVAFLFDREVVPDREQYNHFSIGLDGQKYDESIPSSPLVLVTHMTKLFLEFGQIANGYTLTQVDQAVWAILGANLLLYEFIFDASVPLADRSGCIQSMYHVYSDYVTKRPTELGPELSGFYMWWDLILHGFWTSDKSDVNTWKGDSSKLDSESRVLLEVMFETLKRILELPDRESQRSALHGLGHLYHPGVRDTVQKFIDTHRSDLSLAWLEQCRDGNVL